MKIFPSALTLVAMFVSVACDSSPEDGEGGNGGEASDGSGAGTSSAGGSDTSSGSNTGGTDPMGGSNPMGSTSSSGGGNEGGSAPEPIACCSLFDCPGTEVQCECGSVSGCFITDGECGHCYTEADCEAFCANQ